MMTNYAVLFCADSKKPLNKPSLFWEKIWEEK